MCGAVGGFVVGAGSGGRGDIRQTNKQIKLCVYVKVQDTSARQWGLSAPLSVRDTHFKVLIQSTSTTTSL